MFWPDVIALKAFYATPLGRMTGDSINTHIARLWPPAREETILGLGYTLPYLAKMQDKAHTVFACMPVSQGVTHWPSGKPNCSLLADEAELPFPDNSINRLLLVHALENSEQVRQMMEEVWRVLSPAGRVIAIAPNRRSIWARSPHSPFAYGQPYTAGQLRQLFSEHSFTPLHTGAALFFPPGSGRHRLRSTRLWEAAGSRFFPGFGGIVLLEAEKQIYAPLMRKVPSRRHKSYVTATQAAGI